MLFPPRRVQAWRRRVRWNRHSPLRPRTRFRRGRRHRLLPGYRVCRVFTRPPGRHTASSRPTPGSTRNARGGCCDPCNTLSPQCLPDGHCGPGPVAKTAKSCWTPESGGVVYGNDCCRKDQQCLSPRRPPTAPLCYACPASITDLNKCPNRLRSGRRECRQPPAKWLWSRGHHPGHHELPQQLLGASFKPACDLHDTCYGTWAQATSLSNSRSARSISPALASADTSQNEQITNVPSSPVRPSALRPSSFR